MFLRSAPGKPKAMVVFGMFALSIGLMLRNFVHPATTLGVDWLDGIVGLFMGMSIALNLGSVLLRNRQRTCGKT